MSQINTVLGPITPAELGITAMHEHIGFGQPGCSLDPKWWAAPYRMFEAACDKLGRFRQLGGNTIVDCTGIGFGRDIAYYQVISRATGVNIIACTGFWAGEGVLPFFHDKSIEYMADLFYNEITVGIEGTGVKAGAVKVGISNNGLSELDERIYRAAARVARATGVPILTHLSKDAGRQMDLFEMEGLPLNRVIIGHADHAFDYDPARDFKVAERGAFVGFDTIGYDAEKATLEQPAPPWSRPRDERLRQIVNFLEKEGAHRAIISTDSNCWPLGFDSPPQSVAELLEVFLPDLRAAGIKEQMINQLLVRNPAHLLTMQNPQPLTSVTQVSGKSNASSRRSEGHVNL